MFHIENANVRETLLDCNIGLEKESLRITTDGRMAQTPHPFDPDDPRITRDFCENQTEINTSVFSTAHEAVASLDEITGRIQRTLASQPEREYLWPFSNPPFIANEDDVPVAFFEGARASKTAYRHYLANNYGKYKMAFCGIHFNYSFGDRLLEEDFKLCEEDDFQTYKNQVYLELAKKVVEYGWILAAVTSASPIMDGSFFTQGLKEHDAFIGMGSVRCGDFGYWNHFVPVLDYKNVLSYAASIRRYVDMGLIVAPTELYYPIRLKPRGLNNLERLCGDGIDHIELRMFDLNPLVRVGLDVRDVLFAQLLLIFLASTPSAPFDAKAQTRAIQNFKNAARYDVSLVKILFPNDNAYTIADAGRIIVGQMKKFFADASDEVQETLAFEESKFLAPENRYAYKVYKRFIGGFWRKGTALARQLQEEYL